MSTTSPGYRPFGFRALMCAVVGMGLTSGCAASRVGSVSDGMYSAQAGDFSIRVPRTIFGTSRVEDGSNEEGSWVQFSSDDGSVWRIEYYPIPLRNREMFADSAGRDRFTRGFLVDVVALNKQQGQPFKVREVLEAARGLLEEPSQQEARH